MEWLIYAVVFLLLDKSFVQPHNFAFALSIFLQNRSNYLWGLLEKGKEILVEISLRFICLELCLLKNEAISIPNNYYPVQFSRLICRRRKRNKTGVLHRSLMKEEQNDERSVATEDP